LEKNTEPAARPSRSPDTAGRVGEWAAERLKQLKIISNNQTLFALTWFYHCQLISSAKDARCLPRLKSPKMQMF
jgi:hypothetical protein